MAEFDEICLSFSAERFGLAADQFCGGLVTLPSWLRGAESPTTPSSAAASGEPPATASANDSATADSDSSNDATVGSLPSLVVPAVPSSAIQAGPSSSNVLCGDGEIRRRETPVEGYGERTAATTRNASALVTETRKMPSAVDQDRIAEGNPQSAVVVSGGADIVEALPEVNTKEEGSEGNSAPAVAEEGEKPAVIQCTHETRIEGQARLARTLAVGAREASLLGSTSANPNATTGGSDATHTDGVDPTVVLGGARRSGGEARASPALVHAAVFAGVGFGLGRQEEREEEEEGLTYSDVENESLAPTGELNEAAGTASVLDPASSYARTTTDSPPPLVLGCRDKDFGRDSRTGGGSAPPENSGDDTPHAPIVLGSSAAERAGGADGASHPGWQNSDAGDTTARNGRDAAVTGVVDQTVDVSRQSRPPNADARSCSPDRDVEGMGDASANRDRAARPRRVRADALDGFAARVSSYATLNGEGVEVAAGVARGGGGGFPGRDVSWSVTSSFETTTPLKGESFLASPPADAADDLIAAARAAVGDVPAAAAGGTVARADGNDFSREAAVESTRDVLGDSWRAIDPGGDRTAGAGGGAPGLNFTPPADFAAEKQPGGKLAVPPRGGSNPTQAAISRGLTSRAASLTTAGSRDGVAGRDLPGGDGSRHAMEATAENELGEGGERRTKCVAEKTLPELEEELLWIRGALESRVQVGGLWGETATGGRAGGRSSEGGVELR